MNVVLEPTRVPGMWVDRPGYWVDVAGDPLGLIYRVEHLDGTQTWYGLRWHDEGWHAFDSKQSAIDWIATTARRRGGADERGGVGVAADHAGDPDHLAHQR